MIDYTHFRQLIEEELASVRQQIETLTESLHVKPDYEMGEGDPAVVQWELDQAMLERLQAHEADLEAALRRIEEGTYGICELCGASINPERLEILPTTTRCIKCAQKR